MNNKSQIKTIKKYVSIPEAAKILDVTRGAVYEANKRGSLIFYNIGGRNLLLRRDILKYKKNRKPGRPPNKTKGKKKK